MIKKGLPIVRIKAYGLIVAEVKYLFLDERDINKKGSQFANLFALPLGLEPRTL